MKIKKYFYDEFWLTGWNYLKKSKITHTCDAKRKVKVVSSFPFYIKMCCKLSWYKVMSSPPWLETIIQETPYDFHSLRVIIIFVNMLKVCRCFPDLWKKKDTTSSSCHLNTGSDKCCFSKTEDVGWFKWYFNTWTWLTMFGKISFN